MVTVRKDSIPMPTSLPPPPPEPSTYQQSHHYVDTSDVPPVPSTVHREQPYAANQYEEMGNPWEDAHETQLPNKRKEIPDLLRPGINKAPTQPAGNSNIPDVLRPGWSGEATPRSSLDSDREEREWWHDDPVEQDKGKQNALDERGRLPAELHVVNNTPSPAGASPSSATVKRKPVPPSLTPQKEPSPSSADRRAELGSNNPFRRPSETLQPHNMENSWSFASKSAEQHPHPLRSSPSRDQLGRITLSDNAPETDPWADAPFVPPPPPPSQAPPPIPKLQEPLQPQQTGSSNPWASQPASIPRPSPSPSSFEPSKQYNTIPTDDLLDRGHNEGSISLGSELKAIPNNSTAPEPVSASEISLLEDDTPAPPKPPRPIRQESDDMYAPPAGPPPSHRAQQPPAKPPRPAVVTSEADLAKLREQRNETYQIKHFNWYDMRTSRMRSSSMLTQNKNGPCPLLALVNALILGATEDMQASLDEALRLREQVTLGLIIETLMDELITRATMMDDLQLPEIDELNRFLMRLRTGMNANPSFAPPSQPAPNLMDADTPITPAAHHQRISAGTFENTQDIRLYGSFQVKLVHGWLPKPGDQAERAFARTAQTYEDAQAVQFGEEELEYKLSSGGLTEQEQQVWEDIGSIKQFFQAYPTQLTPYGLETVQRTLEGGEFAIMFRNDHFSTIYKHPQDQRLYTLITDAGYADRDEIIWESLEDITGARSDFYSGDFKPVSHGDTHHAIPHSMTDAANPQRSRNEGLAPPPRDPYDAMTPQEQQEQADMDFALALQMQEEEEQAQRRARNERQAQAQPQTQANRHGTGPEGRRTPQGIPIPLRSNPGGEQRPIIPPRNQNTNRNPAVNRPADAEDADAPPAYEEAARQTAYVPPIGSPLHPASSTDLPLGRASTSTSNVHAQGQTTGVTGGSSSYGPSRPHRRRTSAYGENAEQWEDHSAGVYAPAYAFMSPTGEPSRRRTVDASANSRDERCSVM